MYEALFPFGAIYEPGNLPSPADVAKLQSAYYEVRRALKLAEIAFPTQGEVAQGKPPYDRAAGAILFSTIALFVKKVFPGEAMDVEWLHRSRAAVEHTQSEIKNGRIVVRKAARV